MRHLINALVRFRVIRPAPANLISLDARLIASTAAMLEGR